MSYGDTSMPLESHSFDGFPSPDDSALLHRSVRSESTRSHLRSAGVEPPNTDQVVAARIRGRMEAMEECRQASTRHAREAGKARPATATRIASNSTRIQSPPSSGGSYLTHTNTYQTDVMQLNKPKRPSSAGRAPSPSVGVANGPTIRERIHAETSQRFQARQKQAKPQTQPALPTYPLPVTRLPLPTVAGSSTPYKVFAWFARVLHVDLLADLHQLDEYANSQTHEHIHEQQTHELTIPPPIVDSPFWSSLCTRLSDGVSLCSISISLGGCLAGVRAHPRATAEKRHNWTLCLNTLRVGGSRVVSGADVRGSSPVRCSSPTPAKGSGVVPFSMLFHIEDVTNLHPVTLWTLLAKIYEEYSPHYSQPQSWQVGPSAVDRFESRDTSVRAFIGSSELKPTPTPTRRTTLGASYRSNSRSGSESPTGRRSATPTTLRATTPQHQYKAQRGSETDRDKEDVTPSSTTRNLASSVPSSRPGSARSVRDRSPSPSPRSFTFTSGTPRSRRSASPANRVEDLLESSAIAQSTSALKQQQCMELATMVQAVEQTALKQERLAHTRPIVFQPASARIAMFAERGIGHGAAEVLRLTARTRPMEQEFFGPERDESPSAVSGGADDLTLPATAAIDWDEWPPVCQTDRVTERVVRSWLSDEMDLHVLPSQERSSTPLGDPFRNGTLLCDLAEMFIRRFCGVTRKVPVKRHPTVLMAVLENVVRGMECIKHALQVRQQSLPSTPSALPTPPTSSPAEKPFNQLLTRLTPRLESITDAIVKGDADAMWGVMWHLYTEWNTRVEGEQQDTTQTNKNPATTKHNSG